MKAVKYLFKYVYKGHDRAEIRFRPAATDGAVEGPAAPAPVAPVVEDIDEIKEWQDGRYVSACEAAWRLYGFRMHASYPNVVRLPVHLNNGQQVYFNEDTPLAQAAETAKETMLLRWFTFNRDQATAHANNPNSPAHPCLSTTYQDFPKIAVWKPQQKKWEDRKRGVGVAVGRMYHVMPSEGERYFMRMLLHHVPGATSYEDLRTLEGVVHPTFKAACQARGLLEDDQEWRRCLQEGVDRAVPPQIRSLFVSLLLYNDIADPVALWDEFKVYMAEDFTHAAGRDECSEVDFQDALRALDTLLRDCGGKTLADFQLPVPDERPPEAVIAEERARYTSAQQATQRDQNVPLLSPQQRAGYERIMAAVRRGPMDVGEHVFFVDGVGGAGKTFLYGCCLSTVRANGKVALAVASSGIAALLLEGGRTAHSKFKIPVQGLCETSTCYVNRVSGLADLIRHADLIIWDEAPMMHKHVFEAVDRTFRDIMATVNPDLALKPFGGKVVVLGGDFRQILPVVRRGRKADVIAASLNQSQRIWPHVGIIKLHQNMRVSRLLQSGAPDAEARAAELQAFADYLLRVGNGTERVYPEKGDQFIRIRPEMVCPADEAGVDRVEDLIKEVYGGLQSITNPAARAAFITERAILTPRNEDVDRINKLIIEQADLTTPGQQPAAPRRCYLSADAVVQTEQQGHYPLEFLNKLEFSGVPPHELYLQVGCPIILLRNMTSGLANGTRLIVKALMDNLIDAEVVTGPATGQRVLIPRLSITPSDAESWPFTLRRRQFPVRPAFAMTINKSQGQTFKTVGIYLPKAVFTHGQLYVAKSRVGDPAGVRIMVPGAARDDDGAIYTPNVVYREVLLR